MLGDALSQAADTVVLAAGHHDEPAGLRTRQCVGNAQFVFAAMPAGQHEREVEAFAFGLRRGREAGRFERAEIGAKTLDEVQ